MTRSAGFIVSAWLGLAAMATPASSQVGTRVTFSDVAPVFAERCVGCHRPGGGAPFALQTYEQIRQRASLIAQVTRQRLMPPWKPQAAYGLFADDRRLTSEQIALIQGWVDGGAVADPDGSGDAVLSQRGEWAIGQPDLVVSMPVPYAFPADGKDTIRSFVLATHTTDDRYVRAIEFKPDLDGAIHHANIKIDTTGSSRRLDDDEPGIGFDGSGRHAQFPDGQFLGWTPGQRPHLSDGHAWLLPAGADLVVELHMTPTGKAEAIRPRIGLSFTTARPARLPYMMRLGNQRLDIPPGEGDYVSTDTYQLPVDLDILAVQPHAHNLARSVSGTARLPDGQRVSLIEIVDWDFRWQDVYRYAEPIHLPRGTTIQMEYRYDNSERNLRNPHRPPRRVTFGQTTDAEMGDLWFQVMTASDDDRVALDADFGPKMLSEDTAGDELLAAAFPKDARIKRDLAYCYAAAGRFDDAITQLESALKLDQDSADGYYQLGTVLLQRRRFGDAEKRFRQAIERKPEWSESHNNLGAIRFLRGDLSGALRAFDAAIARDAANVQAHYNRGRVLAAQGKPAAAVQAFAGALKLKPRDADVMAASASATVSLGDVPGAERQYRQALQLSPDLVGALTDLAWILATSTPRTIARTAEAVRLAEHASRLTQQQVPIVLDTLAVTYFAAGRTDDAIAAAELALEMAGIREEKAAAKDIKRRLETYRTYRNPPPR